MFRHPIISFPKFRKSYCKNSGILVWAKNRKFRNTGNRKFRNCNHYHDYEVFATSFSEPTRAAGGQSSLMPPPFPTLIAELARGADGAEIEIKNQFLKGQ